MFINLLMKGKLLDNIRINLSKNIKSLYDVLNNEKTNFKSLLWGRIF